MAIEPRSYGEAASWEPEQLRLRPLRLVVGWVVAAASLAVAAWLLPGVALETTGARVRRRRARSRCSTRCCRRCWPRCGCRSRSAIGFLLVLLADALAAAAGGRRSLPDDIHVDSFGDALLAALVIGRREHRAAGGPRHQRRRRVHAARDAPDRPPPGRAGRAPTCPGIIFLEIDGLALPVLRDAMRDGSAPEHGALDRRGRLPPDRVGDRPLLADRREPGRDPARLQRGHPRLPLGREGDRAR